MTARETLEEAKAKLNDEFSAETENFTPPEVVERINQILTDAIAGLPPAPLEPAPEVDPLEKARAQMTAALPPETAEKVNAMLGSSEPAPTEPVPAPYEPAPVPTQTY